MLWVLAWLAGISPWLGWRRLSLVLPLCVAIAVVYKALRLADLRRLPIAAAGLVITLLLGMVVVGVVLLAVHEAVLRSF